MSKYRVALSGLFYPVAILRYFESALQHRDDVELITIGPYNGSWIPWAGGMYLPEKYALPPTIPLSMTFSERAIPSGMLFSHELLQDIDLWIQCDAGWFFGTRPPAKHVVHIATDPHVLDYSRQRGISDLMFNMQKVYSKPGDIYLPYCASRYHHYQMPEVAKEYDVCLVGLQYPNRTSLVSVLRDGGISVHYELGLGPDEYRLAYSKSRVAISWSSLDDLIARVFEAGAMGLPLVTNRVPDLPLHFYENAEFLGFTTIEEAVSKVKVALSNPNAPIMARNLSEEVLKKHTYDHRIEQIFEAVGL